MALKTKVLMFAVAMLVLAQGAASAAERGTAEYEHLRELKKARREAKSSGAPAEKGFWQREAERSGLAGTGAMIAHAASSTIPLDKPGSRK